MTSMHRSLKKGGREVYLRTKYKILNNKASVGWHNQHDFQLEDFLKGYTEKHNKVDFITTKNYSFFKKVKMQVTE